MRIHHLNCGCMCPLGGALYDGFSRGLAAHLACHCLLVETDRDGLVLVDTGFGEADLRERGRRLSPFFRLMNRIQYDPELSALAQLRRLGFRPGDVRHIVLTHLDFDHAGGLDDFPQAQVHVLQREWDAQRQRHGFIGRRRYRPAQWQGIRHWHFHEPQGERWNGFASVRDLPGLPPEILMIPLPGHTPGHAGIAIQHDGGWLLHAGDAYFYRDEMRQPERHCTPGLRFYQRLMEADRASRLDNQARLRELSLRQDLGLTLFCSHDLVELKRLQEGERA